MVKSSVTDAPFERGREGANLAIGGILGAYLGLGISKNGLAGGSNWDLAGLIFMIALFAGLMNEMPSFFSGRFSWSRLIL